MFALNFCYQPVDLVLVVKCGILEILSMLTNNSCALMNQSLFSATSSGSMLLSGAVRLACTRLIQILTVAARWECRDCKQLWRTSVRDLFYCLTDWKVHSIGRFIRKCPLSTAPVRIRYLSMCPMHWWTWCACSSKMSCRLSSSNRQQREAQPRGQSWTPITRAQI